VCRIETLGRLSRIPHPHAFCRCAGIPRRDARLSMKRSSSFQVRATTRARSLNALNYESILLDSLKFRPARVLESDFFHAV
jgi:hypothetical protein